MLYFQMWRKEREREREWRWDGIGLVSCPSSDLLAEIFFTAPAEIFLKTKQKYFPTAFKLSWCDGERLEMIEWSEWGPVVSQYCDVHQHDGVRHQRHGLPDPSVRLRRWEWAGRPSLGRPHSLSVSRWPQAGGLGRSSVPASSPPATAGPGISVREIQLLR